MIEEYKNRILLPIESDGELLEFMTGNGSLIAKGYLRIVFFSFGPYIEFSPSQMRHREIGVPEVDAWKKISAEHAEQTTVFTFPDRSWVMIHYTKEGNFRINALTLKSTVPISLSLEELEDKQSEALGRLW